MEGGGRDRKKRDLEGRQARRKKKRGEDPSLDRGAQAEKRRRGHREVQVRHKAQGKKEQGEKWNTSASGCDSNKEGSVDIFSR